MAPQEDICTTDMRHEGHGRPEGTPGRPCHAELRRLFLEESPDRLFCSQAKAVVYGVPAAKDAGVAGVYALISGLGSVFRGHGLKNALVRMVLKRGYRRALALADGVFFQNDDDRDVFVGLGLVCRQRDSSQCAGEIPTCNEFQRRQNAPPTPPRSQAPRRQPPTHGPQRNASWADERSSTTSNMSQELSASCTEYNP